jgi:hypothetical protein
VYSVEIVLVAGRVLARDVRETNCWAETERERHERVAKLNMSFEEIFMVGSPSRLGMKGKDFIRGRYSFLRTYQAVGAKR